jgi:hypothetical protein
MFLWKWAGSEDGLWNSVVGQRLKTPLSDHLLELFTIWQASFAGLTPNFELLFERFEVLGSLAYLENADFLEVKARLEANPQQGWTWMPIGRASWHTSNGDKLTSELQADPMKSDLLKAGFARGDSNGLHIFVSNFDQIRRRMRFR